MRGVDRLRNVLFPLTMLGHPKVEIMIHKTEVSYCSKVILPFPLHKVMYGIATLKQSLSLKGLNKNGPFHSKVQLIFAFDWDDIFPY